MAAAPVLTHDPRAYRSCVSLGSPFSPLLWSSWSAPYLLESSAPSASTAMTGVDPFRARSEVKWDPRVWLAVASVVLLAGVVVLDFLAVLAAIAPGLCEGGYGCPSQNEAGFRAVLIYAAGGLVLWALVRCVMRLYLGGRRLGRWFAGAITTGALLAYPFLFQATFELLSDDEPPTLVWALEIVGWFVFGGLMTVIGARRIAACGGHRARPRPVPSDGGSEPRPVSTRPGSASPTTSERQRSHWTFLVAVVFVILAIVLLAVAGWLAALAEHCEGDCRSGRQVMVSYSIPALLAFLPVWALIVSFIRWRGGAREHVVPAGAGIAALLVTYPFVTMVLTGPLGLHGDTQWAIFWTVAGLGWPLLGFLVIARYVNRSPESRTRLRGRTLIPVRPPGEAASPEVRLVLVVTSLVLLAGAAFVDFAAAWIAAVPVCDTSCGSQRDKYLLGGVTYLVNVPVLWLFARCAISLLLGGRRLRRLPAGALTALALWIYQPLGVWIAYVVTGGGYETPDVVWILWLLGWFLLAAVLTVAGARGVAARLAHRG